MGHGMRFLTSFLGLVLLCAGCCSPHPEGHVEWPFQTRVTAPQAFSLFAGVTEPTPVPREVTDLQAAGAVWMDMHVLCRFRAPARIIDSILAEGYERTTWSAVEEAMQDTEYVVAFSPKWEPGRISEKECYMQQVKRDGGADTLFLVVDRSSGLVYAVGDGEAW